MTKPNFRQSRAVIAAAAAVFLVLICGLALSATAQSSGTGTIDPNSVNVTKTVDFTLGQDTGAQNFYVDYAVDRSGNYYVATYLQIDSQNPVYPTPIISKFDHFGQLLWRRQRSLTSVHVVNGGADTYYEQFSSDQTRVPIGYDDYNAAVELKRLLVDDQGNLFAAFDEINQSTGARERTLIVKFDTNGVFQWRRVTPDDTGSNPGQHAIQKVILSANGSIAAAISSYTGGLNTTPLIALKYSADGTRVFNSVIQDDASFIDLASDSAGNLFFDMYAYTVVSGQRQTAYAISRVDTTGKLTGTVTTPYPDTASPYDSWDNLACDSAGNLYVGGASYTGASKSGNKESQQYLMKCDNNLKTLWHVNSGQGGQTATPYSAYPAAGLGISGGGVTLVSSSRFDNEWETARYSADDGHILWDRVYQQAQLYAATNFYVDDDDNVYLAGFVRQSDGSHINLVGKYAGNGDLQFVKAIPEPYSTLRPGVAYRPTFYAQATKYEHYIAEYANPAVVYKDPNYRPPLGAVTSFAANGPTSDGGPITFTASGPSGVKMRVQFTTDPNIKSDGNEFNWSDLFDGGIMTEDPAGSGNYTLISSAYPSGSGISFRAVASKPGHADSKSAPLSGYTLHAKPGLAPTAFLVNDSSQATAGVADTVLRFLAVQGARPAGLSVRVQASTDGSTWNDLPNGGHMTYDDASGRYFLNTNNYPQAAAVSFRAVSSAGGFNDSISTPIGTFDLSSSKQHLNKPRFQVETNTPQFDEKFTATISNLPGDGTVRVQSSTTPSDELSWTTIAYNGGQMVKSSVPDQYLLGTNDLPPAEKVYFRVIASASGYLDSISGACGYFTIDHVVPPKVTLLPPTDLAQSGDGSKQNRLVFNSGSLPFDALVQSDRALLKFEIRVNGQTKAAMSAGDLAAGKSNLVYTTENLPSGPYTIEAYAENDLHVASRLGTSPVYILITPAPGAAARAQAADASYAAAESVVGHHYKAVADGDWHSASTWVDENGNPGVPNHTADDTGAPIDFAELGTHKVDIGEGAGVGSLSLDGGTISGGGKLVVDKNLTITAGEFHNTILVVVNGVVNLLNDTDILFTFDRQVTSESGSLQVFGALIPQGTAGIRGMNETDLDGYLYWHQPLELPPDVLTNPNAGIRDIDAQRANIKALLDGHVGGGLLIGNDGSGIVAQGGGNVVSHDGGSIVAQGGGNLIGNDGSGIVAQGGGNVISNDGSTIVAQGGGNIVSTGGNNIVAQGGGNIVAQGGGNIVAQGGGNFIGHNGSALQVRNGKAVTAAPTILISGGEVNLSSCTLQADVQLDRGVLRGSGVVLGNLTNNGGYIMPGAQGGVGTIGVNGNFTQGMNGVTILETAGFLPTQFDQLQVGGAAALAGALDLKTVGGYKPGTQDVYVPLSFASSSGSFDRVSSNGNITVNSTGVVTSVDVAKPQPGTGQPLNISTRMEVLSGDNVLIAGFIVSGTPGSTKKVMIRGLGPSLANAGVANPLADPLLELHEADGTVITNDNWQSGDTSQIPAGFGPTDPHESVIVADLTIGSSGYSNYTAVLRGADGGTGVGLAEAYDLSSTTGQFANISTRGFVDTGDNVMIGGFIIGGGEPAKVLVRAIGPSLADQGVSGALPGSVLEVHDGNGAVISNQGWRSTQESEIIGTTIPPTNDGDSAIVETLVPGNYTAVVRGANGATGVALVEAYNLQ